MLSDPSAQNDYQENYLKFRPRINVAQTEIELSSHQPSNYLQWAKQQLNDFKFIEHFTEQEKQYLCSHIKIKHYFNGQTIYQRAQACHEIMLVLKGTIKMSWHTVAGKQVIHKFIPSGTLLNIIYVMSDTPFEHDYVAHEATVLAVISGQVVKQLLQQNPPALYLVFEMVCKRNRVLDNDIYHQNTQDLKLQLARQLLYLMENFSGHSSASAIAKLNIKLSQENFADLLRTSRKSIKKELDWFVEAGIIETSYNQIKIVNTVKLKQLICKI